MHGPLAVCALVPSLLFSPLTTRSLSPCHTVKHMIAGTAPQERECREKENREHQEICELWASGAKLREIAAKYDCSINKVNYLLRVEKEKKIQWQGPISAHTREILRNPDGAELSIEGVKIISAEDICRVAQVFEQAVEHCDGFAPLVLPKVATMHRRRVLLAVEVMGLAEELMTHRQRIQVQNDIESLKGFLQSSVSIDVYAKSIGRTRQALHERFSKLLPAGSFCSLERARRRDRAQARIDEVARVAEQCGYDIDQVTEAVGLKRNTVVAALRAAGVRHLAHAKAQARIDEVVRVAEQCEYDIDRVAEGLGLKRHTVGAALRAAGIRHLAPMKKEYPKTTRFGKDQILASLRAAAQWTSPASNHRQEGEEEEREEEDKEDLCGLSLSSTKYTHFYAAHNGTDALSGKHPHIMTVLKWFGSWNKACAEAGLVSSSKRTSSTRIRFTEEQIFAELCAYVVLADGKREKATVIGYSEWAHELPGRPSSSSLRNRLLCGTGSVQQYSSWGSAVCAARAAVAASDSRSCSSD